MVHAVRVEAPATRSQEAFLLKLAQERRAGNSTPAQRVSLMQEIIDNGVSKRRASEMITKLLKSPHDTAAATAPAAPGVKTIDPALKPGVYDVNGHVYVVKSNREGTRLYAKHIVESPDRLNANGDLIDIDFVYEPGAIFNIKPEHRMSFEDAKVLTIRYGRCIACGKPLKAGKSVEQGIGPVCRKKFV